MDIDIIDCVIGWPLATTGINDKESFKRELLEYINMLEQDGVFDETPLSLDELEIPLGFKKATIRFSYWVESNKEGNWVQQEKSFVVESNKNLTEFELLFQIHQESHPILKTRDHHYLEYLELVGENNDGPIYEMILGS